MAWGPQRILVTKPVLVLRGKVTFFLVLDPKRNGKSEESLAKPGKAGAGKEQKGGLAE